MAQPLAYLEAVVGMDITNFRRGAWKVRNELGLLGDNVTGLMALGRDLTFVLTTPVVALGAEMLKVGIMFDEQMRNINSIAQVSEGALGSLSDEVVRFGVDSASGINEAAKALYTVYSAGIDGAIAFKVMEVSTKTAEAGLADITITTEALAAAMLSYGYTTEAEAWRASNALTRMVQVGVGSMQAFAGSIATFMPSAASLGVNIEEAFAINARLTQVGYSASEAATRVNAAMRSMIKPSEAMQATFQKLGVKTTKELITKFGGLTEGIIALREATDGTEESVGKLFGDSRAIQAVLSLTRDIDETRKVMAGFNEGLETATMDAWTQQSMSLSFQLKRLSSAFEGIALTVSKRLLPIITPVIRALADGLSDIVKNNPKLIEQAAAWAGIAAAIPPILWVVQSLISSMNPLTMLIAAIATNFMGVRDKIVEAINAIMVKLQPMIDAFQKFFDAVFNGAGFTLTPEIDSPDMTTVITGIKNNFSKTFAKGDTLWDTYYTSEDLQKMFPSFTEFQNAAFEKLGIDDAGQLKIGAVLDLQLMTKTTISTPTDGASKHNEMFLPEMETQQYQTTDWWDRLIPAGAELWASIKPELDKLWAEVTNWVSTVAIPALDTAGSTVLDSISGWFDGSTGMEERGKTGVYDAFKAILEGDLLLAAQEVGLGDLATTIDGKIKESFDGFPFSGTVSSIATLAASIGQWLIDEAIPSVSRAAGYIVGRLAGMIADAFKSGSFLSAIAGGTAYAAVGIVDPFLGGIGEGLAAGDTKSDGLVGGIADMLASAFVLAVSGFTLINMLVGKGFVSSLGKALSTVIGWAIAPIATTVATAGSAVFGSLFAKLFGATAIASVTGFMGATGTAIAGAFLPVTLILAGLASIYHMLTQTDVIKQWGTLFEAIGWGIALMFDKLRKSFEILSLEMQTGGDKIVLELEKLGMDITPLTVAELESRIAAGFKVRDLWDAQDRVAEELMKQSGGGLIDLNKMFTWTDSKGGKHSEVLSEWFRNNAGNPAQVKELAKMMGETGKFALQHTLKNMVEDGDTAGLGLVLPLAVELGVPNVANLSDETLKALYNEGILTGNQLLIDTVVTLMPELSGTKVEMPEHIVEGIWAMLEGGEFTNAILTMNMYPNLVIPEEHKTVMRDTLLSNIQWAFALGDTAAVTLALNAAVALGINKEDLLGDFLAQVLGIDFSFATAVNIGVNPIISFLTDPMGAVASAFAGFTVNTAIPVQAGSTTPATQTKGTNTGGAGGGGGSGGGGGDNGSIAKPDNINITVNGAVSAEQVLSTLRRRGVRV